MNASVKSYDFSRLASVSSRKLELERVLQHYVVPAERTELIRALEKVLQECVRGGCTLHTKGFRLESATQWQQRLGKRAVYAVLSAVPGGPQALIVGEPVLALSIIDRILAGELTEIAGPSRSLSEIEQGVLSYVLARLCQTCHRFVDPAAMPIRFEEIHEDTESLLPILAGSEEVAVAEVTIALPELSGVVQIVLPELFIAEVMATPAATPRASTASVQRLRELGDLSFQLRASVGSATLTAEEVRHLEPGDIVLLDECHALYDGQALSGELVFHPARHGVPTLVASITDAGTPAKVAIKEIYREA